MKRPSHTVEQLKSMVAWCEKHKRSPADWQAKLKVAIEAQIEAEVEAKKQSKAA